MKTLLQRFTRWFNRPHDRSGTLWEERYKSVIAESDLAARTLAAYIDRREAIAREWESGRGGVVETARSEGGCGLRHLRMAR